MSSTNSIKWGQSAQPEPDLTAGEKNNPPEHCEHFLLVYLTIRSSIVKKGQGILSQLTRG